MHVVFLRPIRMRLSFLIDILASVQLFIAVMTDMVQIQMAKKNFLHPNPVRFSLLIIFDFVHFSYAFTVFFRS